MDPIEKQNVIKNEKQNQFLKKERKQTDDSLVAERDKTTRSLAESRNKADNEMDESVSAKRLEADKMMTESRTDADSVSQKKNADQRVAEERERSDNAIELARSDADGQLEKRRELNSDIENHVFSQERKLTDKNLSFERSQTDTEVNRSANLLTNEITEHSRTKISLTTRDEFLAIVSHDLRNPIGAASSCAEMLLEDPSFSHIEPKVKHWIEFIKRNVDTSLRMISDLLDMERMAEGKLQLKLEKHSLEKIIRHSVESQAHKAAAKTVLLRAVPIVGKDEVMCDHDRILQVLSNLIGNAIKFTPEGGSITIESQFFNDHVLVSVKDTGPGIAPDKLGQIFERFVQIGSNDRRGLGLGLYISKMLIESHGGKIWADSKINKGSTLFFTIPKEIF